MRTDTLQVQSPLEFMLASNTLSAMTAHQYTLFYNGRIFTSSGKSDQKELQQAVITRDNTIDFVGTAGDAERFLEKASSIRTSSPHEY